MKILVLDGRSRATITVVRSLGQAGFEVDVGDEYKTYSTYSKYCSNSIIYPSAKSHPENFTSFIKDTILRGKYQVIIPIRDHTTECLVKLNENHEYDHYLCLPEIQDYIIAKSKINTINLAKKYSIPIPETVVTTDYGNNKLELIKVIHDQFPYPVLLKPEYSSGSRGIILINKKEDLEKKIDTFLEKSGAGLIQEFIPYGGSYGVEMLFHSNYLKAQFTHKRLREFPVTGGPSTYRCSFKYPEIEEYSKRILSALNWNGIAMVEFRIDSRTGIPKLMEINPRFWGSLAMAYQAGVDFPKLLVDLITQKDCKEVFEYNLNIKTRWLFWGDILWLLSWNKNELHSKDFFDFFDKNTYYDILDKNDMLPLIGLLLESLKSILSLKKIKHIFNRGW